LPQVFSAQPSEEVERIGVKASNSKYGKRITTKRTKSTKKDLKTGILRALRALRVLRGENLG
jgi:hypothetical protein